MSAAGGRPSIAAALSLSLIACASTVAEVKGHAPLVRAPAVTVSPSPPDDETLFHAASEADRRGDTTEARAQYEALLREWPASSLADAARFNMGLIAEHAGDYERAAATYAAITSTPLPLEEEARRTWTDAQFRRAACLSKIGGWTDAATALEAVLAVPGLAFADQIEARVGLGIADAERGAADAAEESFSYVVGQARAFEHDANARSLLGFAAEAAFRWGDLTRGRFEAVQLAFPTDVLTQRLESKCEQLLRAQRQYVRAIQLGDAHTAAAAGSRIGGMYARLYEEIVTLTVPSQLNAEEVEVYRAEVRSRVRVLVAKAIRIYERAALAGKRTTTAAQWVEESEAALTRLRALYLDDRAL